MKSRDALPEKLQTALAEVRQVYLDLAQKPIQRNCLRKTECCHFKLTGRTPYLTKGEAVVAAEAVTPPRPKTVTGKTDGSWPKRPHKKSQSLIFQRPAIRFPAPTFAPG